MDAITTGARLSANRAVAWPEHDAARMTRDFLFWRHLRVLRARTMRHLHQFAGLLPGAAPSKISRAAYGVRMESNWNDRTYAYCHFGTYGPYLADLIAAVDVPFQFLDIGANQGLFSLIAAQNPACEAIVALEPVPDTHARLTRNFTLNGLADRAQALCFGLSDRAGLHTIATSHSHSGVATLEAHLAKRDPQARSVTVRMETIAGLLAHLPPDLPIFVKIDVEGHEARVIEQLLGSDLAHSIMAIFFEHDSKWSDGRAIDCLLAKAGFAVTRRYGRGRHFDLLALPLNP